MPDRSACESASLPTPASAGRTAREFAATEEPSDRAFSPALLQASLGAAVSQSPPKVSNSVASTRASAKKNMGTVIKILPIVGVVVLVLLILFLKYRRHIMLQVYYATKPDMPYR